MNYSISGVFYDDQYDLDYLINELSKSYPEINFVDSNTPTTIHDQQLLANISAELDVVWYLMTTF